MKKLIFKGRLRALFPDGLEVNGMSAADCIALLEYQPAFAALPESDRRLSLPQFQSRDALYEATSVSEIVVESFIGGGGGKGGFLMIAIGIALIVAAPHLAPGATTFLGATSGTLASIGGVVALQGLVSVLMPQPKPASTGKDSDGERSAYLPATRNTVKSGTRIPIILGRFKVYGHFVSFQVTATNANDPAAPPFKEVLGAFEATGNDNFGLAQADWTV